MTDWTKMYINFFRGERNFQLREKYGKSEFVGIFASGHVDNWAWICPPQGTNSKLHGWMKSPQGKVTSRRTGLWLLREGKRKRILYLSTDHYTQRQQFC